MVYWLLLAALPVMSCSQSICQKQYFARTKTPSVLLFAAVTTLFALAFFTVSSGLRLTFVPELLPYSLAFGVSYALAWVGSVLALRYGSLALSFLIISFSLIFPTAYGLLILGEKLRPTGAAGFVLLILALFLIRKQPEKDARFSWKWILCVAAALCGNGICAVVSNMQKRLLGSDYTHEYMILALSAAFVLLMAAVLVKPGHLWADFKTALPFAALNGTFNGLNNLLLLMLIGNLPNTILYPTHSALNMLGTFLVAFLRYRERFSPWQYAGYALGAASVILLHI